MSQRRTAEQRFASSWEADESGCHVWIRAKTRDGYGSFSTGETRRSPSGRRVAVSVLAHRWIFTWAHGPLRSGVVVRHVVCHDPSCVNVEHLAAGTQRDNVRDMIEAGRHPHMRRMLTGGEIDMVRSAYRGEYGELRRLAAEFNCLPKTIAVIVADLRHEKGK